MSEFKPGDLVWTKAKMRYAGDGLVGVSARRLVQDPVPFDVRADWVIPDHPALPAVARWLAENPQAVADVTRMLVHLDAAGYFVSDWRGDAGDRASLHGLLAALESGS